MELASAQISKTLVDCAAMGITLTQVQWVSELVIRFSVSQRDYPRLEGYCEKYGNTLKICKKSGISHNIAHFLRHPVLMTGLFLLVLMTYFLPTRVLFIQVDGNQRTSTHIILSAAEQHGIRFGASRRKIASESVKNEILSEVPSLSWLGINTTGCVATISVREKPISGDLPENSQICSIVAGRDGIIQSVTALQGKALCVPGQAVRQGEVLISGYTDCGQFLRAEKAVGEVYALTQRDYHGITPLFFQKAPDSGNTGRCVSLIIGKKRINLWKDSGIWDTSCGRMYKEYIMTLPGGFQLPVSIAIDELSQGQSIPYEIPEEAAEEVLFQCAADRISNQMTAGCIQSEAHTVSREGDWLYMEGKFLCLEMIGVSRQESTGEYHDKTG